MRKKIIAASLLSITVAVAPLAAQATGMPSYNAPYRAFTNHEFGGTLSFANGDRTGFEGQFRFGSGTWDVGLRGGILDTPGDTQVLLGASGRVRVLTHTEQFPLDGAFIIGGGTQAFDNLIVPIGLSLGRRLEVEGSQVSIIPYAQPTAFLVFDNVSGNDVLSATLGLGADFRLSQMFDLRVSVAVGNNAFEGFGFSAVWIR
jgi:hypothetical protein